MSADLAIDITQQRCPMTFVRTRLALDQLVAGQVLSVRLRGDEPRVNVPRTVAEQGHAVLSLEAVEGGDWLLIVRKGG